MDDEQEKISAELTTNEACDPSLFDFCLKLQMEYNKYWRKNDDKSDQR